MCACVGERAGVWSCPYVISSQLVSPQGAFQQYQNLLGRSGSSLRMVTTTREGESMKTPGEVCSNTSKCSDISGNTSSTIDIGMTS